MKPSDRPLEIAELAAPDACKVSQRLIAYQIREHTAAAVAQARLEGAKAMQEAAAKECTAQQVHKHQHFRLLNWQTLVCCNSIKALDPQQVINESMGK